MIITPDILSKFTEIIWIINVVLTVVMTPVMIPIIGGSLIAFVQGFFQATKTFLDICERHWYSKGRVRKVMQDIDNETTR